MYRRSGQTTPRKSRAKSSAYHIRELLAMREDYTERLNVALETRNDTERAQVEVWINGVDTAISAHRRNLAEAEERRAARC